MCFTIDAKDRKLRSITQEFHSLMSPSGCFLLASRALRLGRLKSDGATRGADLCFSPSVSEWPLESHEPELVHNQ